MRVINTKNITRKWFIRIATPIISTIAYRIVIHYRIIYSKFQCDIWNSPSQSLAIIIIRKLVELWLRNRVYFSMLSIANFGTYRFEYYSSFTRDFGENKSLFSLLLNFPFLAIGFVPIGELSGKNLETQ